MKTFDRSGFDTSARTGKLAAAAALLAIAVIWVALAAAQDSSSGSADSAHDDDVLARLAAMAPTASPPTDDEFVHIPPTLDDLEASDFAPQLKETIRRGHDLFVNTQQLRGKNVFNDMNCASCHMGEGRLPFSGPVWPAAVVLPNYRPKNDHVNSLEERIAGCFSFSMNGQPPEYGSDDMLALVAYHRWLAKGVPIYQSGQNMYGRGYGDVPEPELAPDAERGRQVYTEHCAVCHGDDGQGLSVRDDVVFPPLWGDSSYNWGAGIVRVHSLAAFVQNNMPLGSPGTLTDQQAWDVARYINGHERPQDPRYTGDVKETREKYLDTFHKYTLYGTEVDGKLLGDHDNVGEKDFLKPDVLRPRSFKGPEDND